MIMQNSRPLIAAFFILALFFLQSCGEGQIKSRPDFNAPLKSAAIEKAPFFPDDSNLCGPASLAAVLNFHGVIVSPAEVGEQVFRSNLGGTVTLDMMLYVKRRGLKARMLKGTMGDITRAVDRGAPPIVMIDLGFALASKNHYIVVTGYSPGGIMVNSGLQEGKVIDWPVFMEQWKKAGFWTLIVEPKSEPVMKD